MNIHTERELGYPRYQSDPMVLEYYNRPPVVNINIFTPIESPIPRVFNSQITQNKTVMTNNISQIMITTLRNKLQFSVISYHPWFLMQQSEAVVECCVDWLVALQLIAEVMESYVANFKGRPINRSICQCLLLFVCLFVCLSVCLSVCLFVCLSVCLFVCLLIVVS